MTGSGPAGELTFGDVMARLEAVTGRVADVHAGADDAARAADQAQNVAKVTTDDDAPS